MGSQEVRITAGELKDILDRFEDDTEIIFSCTRSASPLCLYRIRGQNEGVRLDLKALRCESEPS